ncbi:peptide/nickel transport system ATP-binding protein [Halorubrum alkaliphilum]|uniref:Peptide/nickel transport system ATP-binding protein n=1 Tax=Halorubrum alkaliphilum TaxID=261290 RepID=A0A8T4GDV3_9EURY|nr:oligopeptide/dipeptide ABC transporter ATP-binding protein [Halorubrum alkaliphilum]MBP1922303.1 peptide/nickel transport system ATP-binding protein [Halorubrum alkaliphilum]
MSTGPDRSGDPLLRTEGLQKYYETSSGFIESFLNRADQVKAVDGVDLEVYPGETLGVVGESGCGKTTLGRSMLRLIEPTGGSVTYHKRNEETGENETIEITDLSGSELRDLRTDVQYIFQDPFSSLNPRLTVGDIVGEPLDIHGILEGEERERRIYELLETVGLNPSHANRYPHEFSGGQRQRIGIARALAVDPELIVCDEPVSALDVSVQAQILNLLEDLQEEFDLAYVFIAHDLSVVEHISDRIAVMYLGELAEVGTTEEIFAEPYHPYTEALLSAIPEPDPLWEGNQIFLRGEVPSPMNPPSGCRFHTRCPRVIPPTDLDVDQPAFRGVMDLRLRLSGLEAADGLVTTADTDTDAGGVEDVTAMDVESAEALVRNTFDIPEWIGDGEADDAVSDAVRLLVDGEVDAANDRLEAVFESPCETRHPSSNHIRNTHEIACLRYDADAPGDRPAVGDAK